jgi:DNA ligase (NAD+)
MKSQEVEDLEQILTVLDTQYEQGEDCIHPFTNKKVSNSQYDRLRKRLEEIAPESDVLKSVTASILDSNVKKVVHNPPMTSISKAIGTLAERTATLKDFLAKAIKELGYSTNGATDFVQAYKRDGIAIALYYEMGKLVKAGLRPRKSMEGEDVTENIKYVEGVPQELWEHDRHGNKVRLLPVTCCIRGEIECKLSEFNKIQADWRDPQYKVTKKPANARNYTGGSIRQFTDPTITKNRRLSFVGYSIVGWNSPTIPQPFKTEIERAKYSNQVLKVPFVRVEPFKWEDLDKLEKLFPSLDYEVDGIVISVNNLEDSEQMGTHGDVATGNPKGKIAWKFEEESAIVTLKRFELNPGRTGKLTPRLNFDPVQLAGTQVSYCTGHSKGFLDGTSEASLGEIGLGAQLRIIKSGKIIPKVIEIVKAGNPLVLPNACPSCQTKLEVREGDDGSDLICPNHFCTGRAVATAVHYLTTFGVKGIAESTVEKLINSGYIKDFSDFYKLTVADCKKAGLSERQSLQAVARIHMCNDPAHMENEDLEDFIKNAKTIKIPGWQFFASLGIPGAGKSSGQNLISTLGTFDAIRKANVDTLEAVPDIGQTTAKAIHAFLVKNSPMLDELLKFVEPEGRKDGKLTGKTFVFTGGFPGGKEVHEKSVTELGGKCSGSVSKKTDYVVVGTDAGSKEKKAKDLGIPTISLADLQKML